MDSQTIREALGTLQVDPDSEQAWASLRASAQTSGGDETPEGLLRLLDAARQRHAERGEWEAVARLLEIAADVAKGSPQEGDLLREFARVYVEELYDDESAEIVYLRLLELNPSDASATAATEEAATRRAKFRELVQSYLSEADQAPDEVYASSMLMRAAEMELRFSGKDLDLDAVVDRLERSAHLDPTNERAGRMLEQIYRKKERWEDASNVLERLADRAEPARLRLGAAVRLARLYLARLSDKERAARAYQRVLQQQPEHPEAMEYLTEFYSTEERWDDLVGLYERTLSQNDLANPERLGDMFQIAMLHWRKRERSADAEPWFDRIRKLEPAHEGMLNFYREYCKTLDDDARLLDILQGAQRAIREPSKRVELASEIAKLAEGQANAQKAIEQYKSVLRQNPDDEQAREALERLYKQTQGYNALVELLRQQLERTPQEKYEERLQILRDVAAVYREYIRSDTALVSVLNQIVQLDNQLDVKDIAEVRELVALYEKLARWRDLLTTQLILADITDDIDEKKTLYRSVARRWMDQFSNVQQATEAWAALFKIAPEDNEARERLEELYRRRRAWPNLYELFERELESAQGTRRVQLMQEMAQLAAERLSRPDDAVRLYRQILDAEPSRTEALDALERHAERSKDWSTLADALERRAALLDEPNAKLVVLQKLGSVYADQMNSPQEAAGAWRRVLELQPGHPRALRVLRDSYLQASDYDALEQLYASQNDWDGLAEVFSNAADRAKESADKIALSYRAAAVYVERLGQPDRAFRSYERALSADPSDVRAATALIPLYEQDEKWARLPPLYELLLSRSNAEAEKLDLLAKLVDVVGRRLTDRKSAAQYARQAYDLSPGSATALALFEEASRAAGSWDPFVEALSARLSSGSEAAAIEPTPRKKGKKRKKVEEADTTADSSSEAQPAEERRLLELKLATVYAQELGRVDEAVSVYKNLLAREPGDTEAAQALELILRRDDRRDDLRWLLALRVENAAGDSERAEILADWAALEEDVFESSEGAIDKYRQLLSLDPAHSGALSALPRLLLAAGDAKAAVEVIESHRDQLEGAARAQREVELAHLYMTRLERPTDALEAAVRALPEPSEHGAAIEVLEQLLESPSVRVKAAEVLASEYATTGESKREAQALTVILGAVTDPEERLALYRRLADVYQQKLGAFGSALDVVLQALRRHPSEIGLWDQAEQLSAQAGRPTDLADAFREVLQNEQPTELEIDLYERAARLHEDRLGDPLGATPYLEKVLALQPSNESAFSRLKDILTAAERWGELEALYDKASQATDDPARRIDMLVEVALICEEIIENAEKATQYYERILEAEPQHDAAVKALDRLYARQGRSRDLALLLEGQLAVASGEELIELKLRLAKIHLELLEPGKAVHHVEDVLAERSNDYQARELAERLLEIGELRVRAARMLESVYEARHEIRDLDRVLAIRLEGIDDELRGITDSAARRGLEDERRDLLRRISTLRDERLHNDAGALEALAQLVPADPLDEQARERLIEVGRRVGDNARVASVLMQAAELADSATMQGEILMQVAAIYEDLLSDAQRAEATYRRVLGLDEADADLALPAARALERIYTSSGQNDKLSEMLEVQVRLEQDGDKRRALLGRLGQLCQDVLGNNEGAISAWRTRAEEDPTDVAALAALDKLYEQTGQWRELVGILEKRRDASDNDAERRALLTRSAEVQKSKLASTSEAVDAYRSLIDQFGPDVQSLRALEELYAAAERWDELAETYENHLDIVELDGERLELLAKLGDLRRVHQSDLDGALEVYRRALSLDTSHVPSRQALEKLLESEETHARREAAEVLHPIYDTEGDHERLLRVIDIEVETADDPLARLDGLETALRVAEGPLGDRGRAYGFAERAVREALGHTELGPWLGHLERLATATGRQRDQVNLLSSIVTEIYDGDMQLSVTKKVAELARQELSDAELSREYYKKALELRPDDRSTLTALESLYGEAGDAPALLDILERRVEVAEDDRERKALLFRRAQLLDEKLDDKRRAIEVYESILDLDLDPKAVEALEVLYRKVEQWSDLIALYQRQLDAKMGSAADLHVKIAMVAAQNQGDPLRAFDELEEALGLDRQHEGAIRELERLLSEAEEAEQRARAASLLEPVYLLRADYDKVMNTIRARLDVCSDSDDRRELLIRLAQLHEEQKEDYKAALETIAKLLADDLGNQTTIHELERLAKVSGAEQRLAEIYADELSKVEHDETATAALARRTGELFAQLGSLDQALSFYRRALAFEPESTALFDAVDGILTRTSRHEERVGLYRDALEYRFEPGDRLRLMHTIAGLQRRELRQPDDAIETYRQALDVDDQNREALEALTELYAERKRWDDLAELHLRRAEMATDPKKAAGFRLSLARLYRSELGSTERAIDQLEEIVRAVPEQAEAVAELESLRDDSAHKERVVDILRPLYESADDWRHLIKLNEDRFDLAQDVAEKVAVLRETAGLWEQRGHDLERACRVLAEALRLDPDDGDVRAEYERLVEQGKDWDRLASLYDEVLSDKPDLLSKRDMLSVLARIHDEKRDDPRRALQAYERLRALDETEMEPLDKIEQLSTLLSDWPVLVRALTAKADILLDDEARASVWRRIGEAKRDMLEDAAGAVQAYERALELEPSSAHTVDCLIALYEDKGDASRLVELYQARVELAPADDAESRYDLLMRGGSCYEKELSDNSRAIELYRQALDTKPSDVGALAALNRLYREEKMWPELLENLKQEASSAAEAARRSELRRQIGDILAEKLQSYEEALEAYRLVLDESPLDEPTTRAVRMIGKDHDLLRSQVAEILVPVLRQTERWDDLVPVLEMRLTVETDPSDRTQTLRTMAETLESRLGRPGEAQAALLRALSEQPEAAELHVEIERLSELSGAWGRYADALAERAQGTFDADLARELYTRLGRVSEDHLKDDERAVQAYVRAVEQAGDQPDLLLALDRLYSRLGKPRELSEVLERRVSIETSDAEQANLYHRLAVLQIGEFSDPVRGLASLRMALEREPSHEAAAEALEKLTDDRDLFEEASEVLEGVYRSQGKTDRLAGLFEKRVSHAGTAAERIDMRRSLARVLEEDCRDPGAAQRVLQQGLADDPNDSGLLDELERLAPITHNWEGAAGALRDAIDRKADLLPQAAAELCVRLAGWYKDKVEDLASAEQALVKALDFESDNDDVLSRLEELQRREGRERDLIDTIRRRAKLQVDDERREALYREARKLADTVGDVALAESILRGLLAADDANLWALAELTELREAASDYKETFSLLVRRSELRAQGDAVRELRRAAAKIARDKLDDPGKAIELFEQLFEDEPRDGESSAALRELYAKTERWQDLGRLLERLVDLADAPAERSKLRLELAKLTQDQFKSADEAIRILRTVIEDEPTNMDAVVVLSELYESTQRDEDLAELLVSQIEAAKGRNDVEAELRFQVRLGEIYDSRLKDRRRAIETYRGVLARDAQHRGALEALTRLYRADGQHGEAAKILDQLLTMSSGDEAVRLSVELAGEYDKLDDKQNAAQALERGLAVQQDNPDLRKRLRQLYDAMKAWEKLAELIAGDSDTAEAVDDKVRLLCEAARVHASKRDDHAAAAQLLDRASQLKPDDRDILLELCDAYSASGRGKAAAEVLERIVESYGGKRSKELGEIHRRLASAYLADGDNQRALDELDKAFRIEPGNVAVLKQLGLVAMKAGDTKKAQQMFRALLLQKLDESSPITKAEVFMHLAEIHVQLGETPKAIQMLERALQSDDKLEAAKTRLAELKGG